MLRRALSATAAIALASLAPSVHGAATSSAICESAAFQALTPVALGTSPLLVRSLIQGNEVCLEFQLSPSVTTAEWLAVGLAASSSMVNSPVTNVMIFRKSDPQPVSYLLGGYSTSAVTAEADQSFFVVHETSTAPLKFSYQRTLVASSTADLAISATAQAEFLWSYGPSWPITGHSGGERGAATYNFVTGASTEVDKKFCDGKNCTAIVGGLAFVVMLVGGFVLTTLLPATPFGRALLHKTLVSPPVKSTTNGPIASPITMMLQNLADLKLGEVLVVLIFIGALAALIVLNEGESEQVVSGQAALLIMMFMILPVTRIPLWTLSFGSSFERIVKFHRWLGMALSIATLVHLIEGIEVTQLFSTTKYGEVYPIWGALAFITFILIGLTANEVMRRKFFDVFYVSHRILSLLGFVFTILHSVKVIAVALAVPLALYVIGTVLTWVKTYSGSYQATVSVHEATGVTTLVLNSTDKTQKFAQHMDLCSYFWVRIPSVSGFQWHPFSAIVTPNGDSIGFCVRALGPPDGKSFSRLLLQQARLTQSLSLNLCGPFGRIAVDVDKYDVVLLIGGGVGITPLLSAVNQQRLFAKKNAKAADWSILWSVRHPQDLLMIDKLMPSQAQLQYAATNVQDAYQIGTQNAPALNATWFTHCSAERTDGVVTRANGEQVSYRGGIPVLDEYINTGRYMNRKVAVLACGPPTMVVEAQALARNCGFDFHKEIFNW